jgi:hypothetical protein
MEKKGVEGGMGEEVGEKERGRKGREGKESDILQLLLREFNP